jgi:tRNA nucleotidyltransferase (CCA-adding enzyme)
MATFEPQAVIRALEARADGAAVLALAPPRTAVVGGFVRDALGGREPREIDLVVEGDARALGARLGGDLTPHDEFLACHVARDGWTIEITSARRERYPQPGALPVVEHATIDEDLVRRDFTVNALAVTLEDARLLSAPGALDDLASGTLRVFHERSFVDDPTRVMRLYRYAHRLGFTVEPKTERLAREATLETLSGARIATELRLALHEDDPLAILAELEGRLPIVVEGQLTQAALSLAPADADPELVTLALVLRGARDSAWLHSLELSAHELLVVEAAQAAESLARAIEDAETPSALRDAVGRTPVEAIAIAGALGPAGAVARWLGELRDIRLEIGGEDLLRAGVPEGPDIGARLDATLRAKLDGLLDGGREVELAYALEAPA